MICMLCGKNDATVHFTRIVNGKKQEIDICEECAKNFEGINLTPDISFGTPFSVQNVINGIMDYLVENSEPYRIVEMKCPVCGTTYSEFKNTGLLGCSECYRSFNQNLMPMIKRVQGNVEHVGRIPKKCGKELVEKKRLMSLKEELQKAILAEEYEKAATIRDEIKRLQKGE